MRLIKSALLLTLALLSRAAFADDSLAYQTETLDNGLKVVYAPLPSSPVTQVRVVYHVGSKDERPDRQGFAHMFEHMMFRGSAHVGPEEHMKRIGLVGGDANAFTTFDQTVYHDTLPSSSTEMALWLEADRMASFKVSPEIFRKERLVVAEEWRWRSNTPYGTLEEELLPEVFQKSSYRWTPMGDMQELLASSTGELQAFFNKYYIPNNAVLVVAGDIDIPKTKDEVHRYFGWIPKGADFTRMSPMEPPQSEARRKQVVMRVPLSRVVIAYRMPPAVSDDNDALSLMLSVLGEGQSSRLSRALVTSADPSCIAADAFSETIGMGNLPLENGGFMGVDATLLNGKDVAGVEKILRDQIAGIINKPVTPEELEKAKQQARLAIANRWQTAESTATELGDYMMIFGNLDRVATERARMEAITPADIQRVAAKYLADNFSNTMIITPGIPPAPATQAASMPATQPVAKAPPRQVIFPADYPTTPPASGKIPTATFDKGVESTLGQSTKLIVMENHRVPMVYWTIAIRAGEDNVPADKAGLASMTSQMLQRGPKGKTYDQFNEELESRGINLAISNEDGDVTRITGSCLTEQLPFALAATQDMLQNPAFDPQEFANLKAAAIDDLRLNLTNPQTVATRTLMHAIYPDSPLGKLSSPDTITAITLDDVKNFYHSAFVPGNAIILLSGDVNPEQGRTAAEKYFGSWANQNAAPPSVEYPPTTQPAAHRIILVDAPVAKQASIRIGIPAYDLASPDKPAGLLIGQILSAGIESRLNKYVRAEKGLVYGVEGYFEPQRHGGIFETQTETKFETAGETVQAIFKVLDDTRDIPIPESEVSDARFRVAGFLVMSMEKIEDQAKRRLEGILDGYPIDYYDKYPERLSKVTPDTIAAVMKKYLDDSHMLIVISAPAEKVKSQLEKLGTVEVVPMPIAEQK